MPAFLRAANTIVRDRIQDPQLNSRVDVRDVILPPKDHEITGTIKFVGHLKNKGDIQYVGVELDKEFSGYGKNDGDYEGYAADHTENILAFANLVS